MHSPVTPQQPKGRPVGAEPTARRGASRAARAALASTATFGAAAVLLAGCVAPKVQTTPVDAPESPAASEPTEPRTIEDFYEQDVQWSDCEQRECATIQAPLDWDDPSAGVVDLAVRRAPATGSPDERIGSLLINPGGPGASGVDFLSSAVSERISEDVLAAYDVVGFDPRGVGSSSAIDCGDDARVDAFYTQDFPIESQEDVEAARAMVREFGESCLAATGALLGQVDTVSAARDMDLLRAVLGDADLNLLGFSYGTLLGATYADLYPERVGRLVLDGAVDPSMSKDEMLVEQAAGFEEALNAYVADCQAAQGCPLTGSVEQGVQQVADLIDRAEAQPLPAGEGYRLNGSLASYGVTLALYDEAAWPVLTVALDEAIRQNTGAGLLALANLYLHRTPDGVYLDNVMVAFTAINCLDYPTAPRDYEEMVLFAKQVQEQAPTFGREFSMGVGCEVWPFQATEEREPITAAGAAPILVVGTTGDPATPYEWSVALAEQLESGRLLTYEGEGHTAYGRSNDCVASAVDAYLLDGTLPQEGLVC